jgi:hypothetical protein
MADTAFITQYRDEFIYGYEQRQSLLRETCTTEAQISGNSAVFDIVDSGGATAVTRGVNGRIPGRSDSDTQVTCTITEKHDKPEKTKFNIFASQGSADQRRFSMQRSSMGTINRAIDDEIITELNTGTVTTGATAKATVRLCTRAKVALTSSFVEHDGNIFAVITPAFEAYLLEMKEFNSAELIDRKPLPDDDMAWDDRQKLYSWMGVKWLVHPRLPGAQTSAEKCFMYHRSAIGHAMDTAGIMVNPGYNEEDAYSYCLTSVHCGAKKLQNAGIVVINHDGSEFAV